MPGYCLNLGWPQKNVWRCPDRPPSIHYQWLFGLLMQPSSEWPAGRWLSRQPLSCLFLYASQGRHSCHVTRGSNGNPLGNVSTCNGLSIAVCVGDSEGWGVCRKQSAAKCGVKTENPELCCKEEGSFPELLLSDVEAPNMLGRAGHYDTLKSNKMKSPGTGHTVAKGTEMPGTLANALKR